MSGPDKIWDRSPFCKECDFLYRLVIAEKPSVAMSIAKVLGATVRKEGYMEGGGWLVSWCVGHLAGLAEPAAYDLKYDKWRREDLPILPENWRFTIGRDKREQFDVPACV